MNTTAGNWRLHWGAFVVALAAVALTLALLGSGLASANGTATASATRSVSIKNFVFTPKKMTVTVGTKVAFTNKDSAPHTATGRGFNTGTLSKGKTKSVTFKRKGTFAYHCMIHPTMKGTVVVK